MSSNPQIPSITLIGDPLENFYQLGLKDAEAYPEIKKYFRLLLKDSNVFTTSAFQTFHEYYLGRSFKDIPDYHAQVSAYAEGLKVSPKEVSFELMIPELMNAVTKFAPNLQKFLLGCSSLFRYDAKSDSIYHGRILDFPMVKLWEKHERIINYKLKNQFNTQSFGVVGNPFASLTCMNEHGLSLALHQKYSDYFNPEGHPIHFIVHKLMTECDSVKSMVKLLKQYPSMTYWGLYLSTKEGKVVAMDVCGDRLDKEEYDLKEVPFLYFNNQPIKEDQHNQEVIPYGLDRFNRERNIVMQKRVKKYSKTTFRHDDMLNLLSAHESYARDTKHHLQSPLTLTSVNILSLNAKLGTAASILGETPRMLDQSRVEIEFKNHSLLQKNMSSPEPIDEFYKKGFKKLAHAQYHFDMENMTEAFHDIQMSISYLENFSEGIIAEFYYGVFQYLTASAKQDFLGALTHFLELEGKLPQYLEDHRKLFIMRLQKITTGKTSIRAEDLQNKSLHKYYTFEINLNGLGLKLLRKLIYPRADINDIIYLY